MQVRHLDRLGVRVDQLAKFGRFRWRELSAGNRFHNRLCRLRKVADSLNLRKVEGDRPVTAHGRQPVHAKT